MSKYSVAHMEDQLYQETSNTNFFPENTFYYVPIFILPMAHDSWEY